MIVGARYAVPAPRLRLRGDSDVSLGSLLGWSFVPYWASGKQGTTHGFGLPRSIEELDGAALSLVSVFERRFWHMPFVVLEWQGVS
jgi:hypothetical protein